MLNARTMKPWTASGSPGAAAKSANPQRVTAVQMMMANCRSVLVSCEIILPSPLSSAVWRPVLTWGLLPATHFTCSIRYNSPGGNRELPGEAFRLPRSVAPPARAAGSRLEQIRVGWDRQRRSTDPVTLRYPFEVDLIHVVRRRRAAVPPDNDPI